MLYSVAIDITFLYPSNCIILSTGDLPTECLSDVPGKITMYLVFRTLDQICTFHSYGDKAKYPNQNIKFDIGISH